MKVVRSLENMSNLEALVIQDLKDIGIKVPKLKKDTDDGNNQTSGIFGRYLSHLPCTAVEDYGLVPVFLVNIMNLIEKNVDCEGIFRKSGSVSRLKDLRLRIESGEDISDACVLDLCGLLKQFFRDLQEPLLTARLQESFLACYDLVPAQRVSAVLLLCHLLPDSHLATLRFTANFLHHVAAHSDSNKMDAANIAVCLAPNIFHERTNKIIAVTDGESARSAMAAPTAIVELLIEHSNDIGAIDVDLQQRLVLMTTCFNDSAFEETELEVTENREKKRSGSFQGLISNLSSSFTKWRNKDKLNMSGVQCASATVCPSSACDGNFISLTPVVMRKRKADDDPLPFSTGKKLAILQSMPQNTVLGSTPYASCIRKGKVMDNITNSALIEPHNTLCCKKLDHNFSVDDLSEELSEKRKSAGMISNKVRRGNSLDSSPVNSPQLPKNKVRKSFEGLIRRLSGGKDNQSREKHEASTQKRRGSKESFHLPQRSPSAPSFGLGPQCDSNTCLLPARQSLHASYSCQGDESPEDVCFENGKRRQRSLSADGSAIVNVSLRRGRPNTVRSGLPSPLHRRPSEVESCPEAKLPVECCQSSASLIDTSPIVANNQCSPQSDNSDSKEQQITQAAGDRSFGDAPEFCSDALDQAFIGSTFGADAFMLANGVDLDESGSCRVVESSVASHQSDGVDKMLFLSNDVASDSVTSGTTHNSVFDLRRPKDPMERFVALADWHSGNQPTAAPSLSGAGGGQRSVPKIKPSLMSDTISKRLFVKTNSPHVSRSAVAPFSSPVCARRNADSKGLDRLPDLK